MITTWKTAEMASLQRRRDGGSMTTRYNRVYLASGIYIFNLNPRKWEYAHRQRVEMFILKRKWICFTIWGIGLGEVVLKKTELCILIRFWIVGPATQVAASASWYIRQPCCSVV